jgi:hypothetical protein
MSFPNISRILAPWFGASTPSGGGFNAAFGQDDGSPHSVAPSGAQTLVTATITVAEGSRVKCDSSVPVRATGSAGQQTFFVAQIVETPNGAVQASLVGDNVASLTLCAVTDPLTAGTYTFTLEVTNSGSSPANLTVLAQPRQLTLTELPA